MPRFVLTALLLALLAVPATPARALPVEIAEGLVTVTIALPSTQLPMQPGVASLLLLSVLAPDGTRTILTVQGRGIEDPYLACRPVDAPAGEFYGWLACEGVGSWALALTIPAQDYVEAPLLCDQLLSFPVKVTVAVDNVLVAARVLSAAYRPCWRVALPLVAR